MIDLRRRLAPISDAAWAAIDAEAARVLTLNLAARKLVDFCGPLGWHAAALNTGRTTDTAGPIDGVTARTRQVQPLVELRVFFELSRDELDDIDRGAKDTDLDTVIDAATQIARAEDAAVFNGYAAAAIRGIKESSPHAPISLSEDYLAYPASVSEALETLREAGVDGPYAIALGPRCYAGLMRALGPGGYPIYQHIRKLFDDRVVWAPSIDGAVVLSVAEGNYELTVGQDLSIGYAGHTETAVRLYIVESFTFRVLMAEAAVALSYGAGAVATRGAGGAAGMAKGGTAAGGAPAPRR